MSLMKARPREESCCDSMHTLASPDSQCNIELNDEGELSSCDDPGSRLPALKFCPWCGTHLEENTDATVH